MTREPEATGRAPLSSASRHSGAALSVNVNATMFAGAAPFLTKFAIRLATTSLAGAGTRDELEIAAFVIDCLELFICAIHRALGSSEA